MDTDLPQPKPESLIYEDDRLYVSLAQFPIARGHSVVVWKEHVPDLHLLEPADYEYLMACVDDIRTAMLAALGIEKVYLMYMDEAKHVHWHLVPRYNEQGFDVFRHKPEQLNDFSLAMRIRAALEKQ